MHEHAQLTLKVEFFVFFLKGAQLLQVLSLLSESIRTDRHFPKGTPVAPSGQQRTTTKYKCTSRLLRLRWSSVYIPEYAIEKNRPMPGFTLHAWQDACSSLRPYRQITCSISNQLQQSKVYKQSPACNCFKRRCAIADMRHMVGVREQKKFMYSGWPASEWIEVHEQRASTFVLQLQYSSLVFTSFRI